MKDTFGYNYSVTISGESHGEAISYVIDGPAPGTKLDTDFITSVVEKRKAKGRISAQREGVDELHIVSGYFNDHITGIPSATLIENANTRGHDYEKTKYRLHPSHTDYTTNEKYMGWQDYRGGGHFSSRTTAPLVAADAIVVQVLKEKGILIGSHVQKSRAIEGTPFSENIERLQKQVERVNTMDFVVLDDTVTADMKAMIEEVINEGDSVGGILESCILNVPAGLGESFFGSLESALNHLLFSTPTVRGTEFGLDFGFSDVYGSEANDPTTHDKGFHTATNNNGGINGGVSNGIPIRTRTAIKPTASIYKGQNTVNLKTHEAVKLQIQRRHDSAITHRARTVVGSTSIIGILDQLMERPAAMTMK